MLLVQSCSATKVATDDAKPALEIYDGYFYRIIKKAMREGALRSDLELRILSAEHGLLHPQEPIQTYDRRMDPERARALRPDVLRQLSEAIERTESDHVVINVGSEYREALAGIDERTDAQVHEIDGDGIGHKGEKIKQFIRGEIAVTGS